MLASPPGRQDFLLALPIKGESFLLRRAGKTVLVDGGYEKDKIAHVLEKQIKDVQHLDIVVCTHGDGDHVGGLPALLDNWVGRVGQLWLPGRWVNVIPQLTCNPVEFFNNLISELDAELKEPSKQVCSVIRHADDEGGTQDDQREISSPPVDNVLEPADELLDDFVAAPVDHGDLPHEPEWFVRLRRDKEKLASDHTASRAIKSARRRVKYRQNRQTSELTARIACYWLGLIETAQAIRDLAIAAIRHGIRTRWFDFEKFAKTRQAAGGARGFLVPINAVEQATPLTMLARWMHLTQINRESLVFLAPPTRRRFGVLFCADSPLGDGPQYVHSFLPTLPPSARWIPMVATAPHHGSETNKAAYDHLRKWPNVRVLLRAGGSVKQPGRAFLQQHSLLRLCAKCPRVGHAPMLSGVVGLNRPFSSLIAYGRRCDCSTLP